jgi:16S rRNA (cytosine1402-N4)-methyltransferase
VDFHPPVLLEEVIGQLRPGPGVFLDATCGTAGHSLALLGACQETRVVAIECDPVLAQRARQRVRDNDIPDERFILVEGAYNRLHEILDGLSIDKIDGCLFDLGANALHFSESGRGFSFRSPGEKLDMRFNPQARETAADILARSPAKELERIFRDYGDERWARRIALWIAERQTGDPIRTAGQLADLVERAIPRAKWPPGIHPATRVFQSLRIRVNAEFENISQGVPQAIERLRPLARIAAITFHSGEDRIVKNIFRNAAGGGPGDPITGKRPKADIRIITRKPVVPTAEEVEGNPGSRSAKLRVAEKLEG